MKNNNVHEFSLFSHAVNIFLLFLYYLPKQKDVSLHFNFTQDAWCSKIICYEPNLAELTPFYERNIFKCHQCMFVRSSRGTCMTEFQVYLIVKLSTLIQVNPRNKSVQLLEDHIAHNIPEKWFFIFFFHKEPNLTRRV